MDISDRNESLEAKLILASYSFERNTLIREAITENTKTSAFIIKKIAKSSCKGKVLANIAKHPNTPFNTILELADFPNRKVQIILATSLSKRINLSSAILEQLFELAFRKIKHKAAVGSEIELLIEIAKHPNTSISLLEKFFGESYDTVMETEGFRQEILKAVVINPTTSFSSLEKLANDSDDSLRFIAKKTLLARSELA